MEIALLIITILFGLVIKLIRKWANDWETRLLVVDRRLESSERRHGEHETALAENTTRLEYIGDAVTVICADVKKLLSANGHEDDRSARK